MKSANKPRMRVCWFHSIGHARAAVKALMTAGVQPQSIYVVGGSGNAETTAAGIRALKISDRNAEAIAGRLERGGFVIAVPFQVELNDEVRKVFAQDEYARTLTYEPRHDLLVSSSSHAEQSILLGPIDSPSSFGSRHLRPKSLTAAGKVHSVHV